ncbi:hypothetical protein NDN08_007379 [Rhodosorus marinus]|uniref:Pirin N-terminal domain-containing protein n=1 Tax=Rhodosorus marinus TaxID=101924 RepID=A0AAV8UXE8_9RHOD|nr:hypothetical protein NDN08_007379 [Rhodosorus marinus]
MAVSVVPKESLYVSEPDPAWFGNGQNDSSNARWTNANWLKSRFHFSFAENMSGKPKFGVLRVLNDDLVQPSRGFGTHPHSNMEIVTYVVDGELTHKDSMGTSESLGRGSIQFMTAGTGVMHSEYNDDDEKPLRFIQMWILPRKRGLEPNYGSYRGGSCHDAKDKWVHLVSSVESEADAKAKVNQDVNIYGTELSEAGKKLDLDFGPDRQVYVLAIEGSLTVDLEGASAAKLNQQDAAEIVSTSAKIQKLEFSSVEGPAHVLVVEMARA